jgi:hypothetical protein
VVVLGVIAGLVAFFAVRKRHAAKSVSSPADGYSNAPLNSPPPMSQQSMYSNPTHKGNPTYTDNPAYGEHAALRVYVRLFLSYVCEQLLNKNIVRTRPIRQHTLSRRQPPLFTPRTLVRCLIHMVHKLN